MERERGELMVFFIAALRIAGEGGGHGLLANGNGQSLATATTGPVMTNGVCASIEEEYVTTRSQNRRTSKVSRCLGNTLCMPQNLLCFKVWPVIILLLSFPPFLFIHYTCCIIHLLSHIYLNIPNIQKCENVIETGWCTNFITIYWRLKKYFGKNKF